MRTKSLNAPLPNPRKVSQTFEHSAKTVKLYPMQGFSSQHAHRALTATHDCGTEAALGWLVENAAKLDQESDEQQHNIVSQPSEGPSTGGHCLNLLRCCGEQACKMYVL